MLREAAATELHVRISSPPVALQQQRQEAVAVADQAMELTRSVPASKPPTGAVSPLLAGRDESRVDAQWASPGSVVTSQSVRQFAAAVLESVFGSWTPPPVSTGAIWTPPVLTAAHLDGRPGRAAVLGRGGYGCGQQPGKPAPVHLRRGRRAESRSAGDSRPRPDTGRQPTRPRRNQVNPRGPQHRHDYRDECRYQQRRSVGPAGVPGGCAVMSWLPTRLRRRRDGAWTGQGGAALILALLFILIVTATSLAVAAVTLSQVIPSQAEEKTGRTVHAAEAGFDAALNQIRAANDGNGNGLTGQLPCGPISGSVGPNEGSLTYRVTVKYYATDPTGQSDAWLNNSSVPCTAGTGTASAPGFALLLAKGAGTDIPGSSAGAGNRSLQIVYRFKVTNRNVSGGLIHVHDQLTALCLDVSDRQGVGRGNQLTIQPCDRSNPGQIWSYTKDLLLQVTATDGTFLCLQSERANTGTGQPPIKLAC